MSNKRNKKIGITFEDNDEKVPDKIIINADMDNIKRVYNIDFTNSFPKKNTTVVIPSIKIKSEASIINLSNQTDLYVCLYDYVTKTSLPLKTNILCYHDGHSFDTPPIFCPIKPVPSYEIISYMVKNEEVISRREISFLEIVKLNNTIQSLTGKEKLTVEEKNRLEKAINFKKTINEGKGFEGTKIFCSWNCLISFIKTKKMDKLYEKTEITLPYFYKYLTGKSKPYIEPAKDKEILKSFGGWLTIEEYRSTFETVRYVDIHQLKRSYQFMYPAGNMYQAFKK